MSETVDEALETWRVLLRQAGAFDWGGDIEMPPHAYLSAVIGSVERRHSLEQEGSQGENSVQEGLDAFA